MEATGATEKSRYTLEDVLHRATLEELITECDEFRLIEYNCQNYSIYDLIPADGGEEDLEYITEEIKNYIEESDPQFTAKPQKNDIVLAEKPRSKTYQRCMISSFAEKNENIAQVYWIDVGGTGTVNVSNMKPVSEDIMQYPRIAYSVVLQGMLPISNYMLCDDFVRNMEKLRNLIIVVELGDPGNTKGLLYCKNKVKLSFKVGKIEMNLVKHLDTLKRWEWEDYISLTGRDEEVHRLGEWGCRNPAKRHVFMSTLPMPYKVSPECTEFSAMISRVLKDNANAGGCILRLVLINDRPYFNYFNVMHHQLSRFAQKNTPRSDYAPAVDEPFMLKIAEKLADETRFKCVGRWLRATRLYEKTIYLIDTDDLVRYSGRPDKDFQMRPLYGEFYRVPQLCITALLKDEKDVPIPFKIADKLLKAGKRYQFKITKTLENMYEVTVSAASSAERKLSMSYFLSSVNIDEVPGRDWLGHL